MILIIDNHDSFVHNLARYVRQLCDEPVSVVRNDQAEFGSPDRAKISALIVSPGPQGPQESGPALETVRCLIDTVPILGVCLGHQIIVAALGGEIRVSGRPVHGKSSLIFHDQQSPIFARIPSPFTAGRYHSLVANTDNLPSALKVVAESDDGTVMAVEHVSRPVFGVQFHPESVLTEFGYQLLFNFLESAGLSPRMPAGSGIFA